MQSKRVRDFMNTHYATLAAEQPLAAGVRKLLEYHQSAIPVVDAQCRLIGLLSEADCMRSTLLEGYYNEGVALVGELMTPDPETVEPDLDLAEVSARFLGNNRRMMPVVEEGQLQGVVSRQDILRALVSVKDKQLNPDGKPKKDTG